MTFPGNRETSERTRSREGRVQEAEGGGRPPPGDLRDREGQLARREGKGHSLPEAASAQLRSGTNEMKFVG